MKFFLIVLLLINCPVQTVFAQELDKITSQISQAFERSDFRALKESIQAIRIVARTKCILQKSLPERLNEMRSRCERSLCEHPFKGLVQVYDSLESRQSVLVSIHPNSNDESGYTKPCRRSLGVRPEKVTIDSYQMVISTKFGKFGNEVGACVSLQDGDLYLSIDLPGDGTAEEKEKSIRENIVTIAHSIDFNKVAAILGDMQCEM